MGSSRSSPRRQMAYSSKKTKSYPASATNQDQGRNLLWTLRLPGSIGGFAARPYAYRETSPWARPRGATGNVAGMAQGDRRTSSCNDNRIDCRCSTAKKGPALLDGSMLDLKVYVTINEYF